MQLKASHKVASYKELMQCIVVYGGTSDSVVGAANVSVEAHVTADNKCLFSCTLLVQG